MTGDDDSGTSRARKRFYSREKEHAKVIGYQVDSHPLAPVITRIRHLRLEEESLIKKNDENVNDDCSENLAESNNISNVANDSENESVSDILDPLSALLHEQEQSERGAASDKKLKGDFHSTNGTDLNLRGRKGYESTAQSVILEKWQGQRGAILQRYTVGEKSSISVNFAVIDENDYAEEGPISNFANAAVYAKSSDSQSMVERLEKLTGKSGVASTEKKNVEDMLILNQQDYLQKICELNRELLRAWRAEERVRSLKVVIQCCKLLNDTSVVEFYPSKFVLISEILDTFGRFVFLRIRAKSQIPPGRSPAAEKYLHGSISKENASASARETCSNWFYKIACIRELVPRVLVECALLRCYQFIASEEEIKSHICRLQMMIRGVGDPLVGAYLRAYLCKVGPMALHGCLEVVPDCVKDFLRTFDLTLNSNVKLLLLKQRVDRCVYVGLFSPALIWMMTVVKLLYKKDSSMLDEILEKYRDFCKEGSILKSILQFAPAEYVSEKAGLFLALIRESYTTELTKGPMYYWFGKKLVDKLPHDDLKAVILEDVRKKISRFSETGDFLECFEVWLEFSWVCFGPEEVGPMLRELCEHNCMKNVKKNRDSHFPMLVNILKALLRCTKSVEVLFAIDGFLSFWDVVECQISFPQACREILAAFSSVDMENKDIVNPVTIKTLLRAARAVHNSVGAGSSAEELSDASSAICVFIRLVSFGRDFEKHLEFLTQCRNSFFDLDEVTAEIIHSTCNLIMKTYSIAKGAHSPKTAVFVRSCIAFCFITIPSLDSFVFQLKMYLHLAQICTTNHCLPQADSCFKACIKLVNDLPTLNSTFGSLSNHNTSNGLDSFLEFYIGELMSSILLMPDDPEKPPLYLLNGLLNVVNKFPWKSRMDSQCCIYFQAIDLLCAYAQSEYIVALPGVDSNDKLYAGSTAFVGEVNKIIDQLVELILVFLSKLKSSESTGSKLLQSYLSMDLLSKLLCTFDMNNRQTIKLVMNLWGLSAKCVESYESDIEERSVPYGMRSSPSKYLKSIIKYVKSRCSDSYLKEYSAEECAVFEKILLNWRNT